MSHDDLDEILFALLVLACYAALVYSLYALSRYLFNV